MNTIRVSHHDLPNPAKRISELEAELLRVRAALDVVSLERKDLAASLEFMIGQRDALRARLAERDRQLFDCQSKSETGFDSALAGVPDAGGALTKRQTLELVFRSITWALYHWNGVSESEDRGRSNHAVCIEIYDDGSGTIGNQITTHRQFSGPEEIAEWLNEWIDEHEWADSLDEIDAAQRAAPLPDARGEGESE